MTSVRQKVVEILMGLAKEHGSEAFVSPGYAYYDDAKEEFTKALNDVRRQAIEDCAKLAETSGEGFSAQLIARDIRQLAAEGGGEV